MTIAQAICWILGAEFIVLLGIDIWLAATKRQMITDAIRDYNNASGWIIGGIVIVLAVHLFILPYAIEAWHRLGM